MRVTWGIGAIIAVLLPIALLLFAVLNLTQTVSAILLLNGAWKAVYGLSFAPRDEKLYQVTWGGVFALLSTFAFLPLQYTVGMVILAIIGAAAATVFLRPNPSR